MKKKKDPNPGSKEAIAVGCTCPVMDNHYGAGYGGQEGVFAYIQTCPIHGWDISGLDEVFPPQENDTDSEKV